ncbi:MAG: hypothetical protein Q9180_008542 [Flavoplaca navasiana]
MSESQLLVKVTKTEPVDGKETFIISTQTFKFQLCIPNEDEHGSYYDAMNDVEYSILNGREKVLQLIDSIAKTCDKYPMEGLGLKLKGHADELEQLAFYFLTIRELSQNDCNDFYALLEAASRLCNLHLHLESRNA